MSIPWDPDIDPNNWYSEQVPMTSVPTGEFQSPNLGLEVMEAPASECCAYEGGFHGGCAYGGSYYGEGCHGGVHGGAPTYLENHTHPSPSFSPPDSSYFPQSYPELQNPLPPLSFEQRISSQFKKITEALHHIYSATPNPPIPSFAPTNCSYLPPSYPSDYVCTHVSPLSSSTTSLILPIAYTPTHPYSASVTLSHSEIPNFTPPPPLSELPMPYQPPSLILESHSNSWSILPHPSSMPMANDVHAITVQSLPSSHLYQQSTVDSSVSQFESLGLELHMGTLLATQSSSPKLVLHTNLDIDDKLQLVNLEATSLTPAIGNDSSPFSIQSPIEEDIKCWSFRELEKTSIELFQSGDTIPGSKFSICCNDVGHFNFNCTNGCSASGFASHEDYENSDAFGECKSIPPSDTHCPNMGQFHPAPESPPNTGHTHVQFGDFEGNPSYPKKLTLILKKKKQWSMRMKRKLQVLRKGKNLANGNSKTTMSSPQVMGQLCKVPWPLPKFHKLIHMFRHPRYYHPECGFAEFAIVLLNENKYGYVSSLVNDHFGRLNMAETSQCAAFNLDFHQSAINMAFLTDHMGDKVYESHILQKFLHDIIKLGCEYNLIIGTTSMHESLFGENKFDKFNLNSELVIKRIWDWERWQLNVGIDVSVEQVWDKDLVSHLVDNLGYTSHSQLYLSLALCLLKRYSKRALPDNVIQAIEGNVLMVSVEYWERWKSQLFWGISVEEFGVNMWYVSVFRKCKEPYQKPLRVAHWSLGFNGLTAMPNLYQCSAGGFTVECLPLVIDDLGQLIDVIKLLENAMVKSTAILQIDYGSLVPVSIYDMEWFTTCLEFPSIEKQLLSSQRGNMFKNAMVKTTYSLLSLLNMFKKHSLVIGCVVWKFCFNTGFYPVLNDIRTKEAIQIVVGCCIGNWVYFTSHSDDYTHLHERSSQCFCTKKIYDLEGSIEFPKDYMTYQEMQTFSLRIFQTVSRYKVVVLPFHDKTFVWQNTTVSYSLFLMAAMLAPQLYCNVASFSEFASKDGREFGVAWSNTNSYIDKVHYSYYSERLMEILLNTPGAKCIRKPGIKLEIPSELYSNPDQSSDMKFMIGECKGSSCLELNRGFSSLTASTWCHYNLGTYTVLALLQNFVTLWPKVSNCFSIEGCYKYGTHLLAGPNSIFWQNNSTAHHYSNAWGNCAGVKVPATQAFMLIYKIMRSKACTFLCQGMRTCLL